MRGVHDIKSSWYKVNVYGSIPVVSSKVWKNALRHIYAICNVHYLSSLLYSLPSAVNTQSKESQSHNRLSLQNR